jgi:PAS domain S-box-containing protein
MRPWSSLRRKLPLLISALLGLVVTAVCWSAYRQVEGVLLDATGTRLRSASQQLAGMLEESARRVRRDTRVLAADPALVAALVRPSTTSRSAAQHVLEQARTGSAQPSVSYALWSRDGEHVVTVGPVTPAGDGRPTTIGSASMAGVSDVPPVGLGPLVRSGAGVLFQVAAPVLGAEGDTIGLLVVERRVASGQAAGQIGELIGTQASLLVGNVTGDVWTDLTSGVAGPSRLPPLGVLIEYPDAGGEQLFGVATRIRSTPWLVLIQRPRWAALAPAREFVVQMAGVALVVVVLGTGGAWILSHRVTAPLVEVTRAAKDLARGDYARRVDLQRHDELGSLATSFNSMASQVEAATLDLQGYARELEAANASLRASEERYRQLVEASHEGIGAVDPTGIITFANPRLTQMLGYDGDALLGRSIFDFMDPEHAFEERTGFVRRYRGIAETQEVPFRRRDGTMLWTNKSVSSLFDAAGALTGALVMISDVTERHEAQARLERSERQFRALTENASDMICVLDADGRQRYVSSAHVRFVGFEAEELQGRIAFDFIHPDDVPHTVAAFEQALRERGERVAVQFRYRHKNGDWRQFLSIATNLLDDPAVAGVVVNSRDITEQRALEMQLLQAQKMEAVGQLAGGIAHDFNNLLSVMTSYTGMLLADLPADDPARADIEEIRRAAQRASTLTRQLLAFGRQQMLQPEVLDLNVVVRDMEKMLGRVLRENVRLETALTPELGRVYADLGQLEQVIVNLAVNASDAMPAGGALTIETADVELDEAYCRSHAGVTPGSHVMLAVSDTGIGMDPTIQARMFDPFFTTKAVGKGTGLGLSTVYGIVKQSGGHVSVYSEPGIGTTIKIYLPRDGSSSMMRPRGDAAPSLHQGSGTVLLVEDEAPVRAAVRRILERAGYTVLEAANGRDALELCTAQARQSAPIELLLTDMVMPDMGGRELAARFRELHPAAALAFMSGYTEDAALRQGAFGPGAVFIEKPFTPETLTQKLRDAREGVVTVGES